MKLWTILLLVLWAGPLFAEETKEAEDVDAKALEFYKTVEINVEQYKNVVFTKKSTSEKIEFKSLSDTEQRLYVLWQLELFTHKLTAFQNVLDKKSSPLAAKVLSLRKETAVRFETAIGEHFAAIKDIPQIDKTNYLNKIKRWHEDNKLIERNK